MAVRAEKPACLVACSSHSKGVSAQSFTHAFTLTSSAFNVFLATPEGCTETIFKEGFIHLWEERSVDTNTTGGKPIDFVDVDASNQQFMADFCSKPIATPHRLETMDSSPFIALLIPSCPGALFDLATNHYLAAIVNMFLREKKPICAVGYGVAGLFSTLDRQTQQWNFSEYSLTGPSTFEVARREDFSKLPIIPSDFMRKHGATYSAGKAGGIHVVINNHVVTGQNEQSTLAAVQNLILISNARLTRPR